MLVSRDLYSSVVGVAPGSPSVWSKGNGQTVAAIIRNYQELDVFIEKLNLDVRKSGLIARLPTELEWESCYYSSVDESNPYPWPSGHNPDDYSVYSLDEGKMDNPPNMASKKPTGRDGWYDMAGYATEVVADFPKMKQMGLPDWREYPNKAVVDFCAEGGRLRVLKGGGCFTWKVEYLSASYRLFLVEPPLPSGFRVALEVI